MSTGHKAEEFSSKRQISDERIRATRQSHPATEQEHAPNQGASERREEQGRNLRAVGMIGLATMLSRILGLIREMLLMALFPRVATDAYCVAFRLPNLFRRLLAEGILSAAFIPVFSRLRMESDEARSRAWGAIFSLFVGVLLGVTLLGMWVAPWLVRIFAPGFLLDARYELAVQLTRVMFPFLFLVGTTSFFMALLNTFRHFTVPALGPVCLNIGVILCALCLRSLFPKNTEIFSMAVGVLVGGVAQLSLQWWMTHRMNIRMVWNFWPTHGANREIVSLMMPTLLGMGVYQLNVMIASIFASYLPRGDVSLLNNSERLMELPLGVIAVTFATVSLPALSAHAERQDWGA
ncbi:MAG: murein biosynthesis integral membrane protein MurJ, partial [Myxococcota bacterium]